MKISGNTILITGGASGIGLELTKQLSLLKNTIIVTGRNQAKLDQAKKDLPDLHAYKSDVTSPDAIAALYSQVTKDFPALNILINNAGVMKVGKFYKPDGDLKSVTEEITTNLNGPIWMTHQFIPHLKKQKDAAIMNVTSLLGIIPLPMSPVYSASKAGLRSFTMSLRAQLKHTSIKVFDLAPPATQTDLVDVFDKKDADELNFLSAKDLAKAAVEGIQKNRYDIRPGQSNQIYYISKFGPQFALKLLSKSLDRMLQSDGELRS